MLDSRNIVSFIAEDSVGQSNSRFKEKGTDMVAFRTN
jgi:hypothetical protein